MVAQPAVGVEDPLIQHTLLGEAVDLGPAAVFVIGEDRRYVAVNQTACDLLGYTRRELLELRPEDLAPAARVEERFAQLARNGELAGVAELRARDGSIVRLRYSSCETTVAHMRFWISVGFPE